MTESDIQTAILHYLSACPDSRWLRQNTGVAKLGGRTTRFGTPGQADIRGIVAPIGRLVEIEVKSRTGRQSEQQKKYQAMLNSLGAVYILARCVEDVWAMLTYEFPDIDWPTPGSVL